MPSSAFAGAYEMVRNEEAEQTIAQFYAEIVQSIKGETQ